MMNKEEKQTAPPESSVRGSNQSGLRAHNERLVLTLIRQNGPLAKADIARRTGLSAQTVSVIMRALEADGLLEKRDPVRGKVGQPSVPMGLAPKGAFFLGLKVGRRSLDLILIDFVGTIVGRQHHTHRHPSPDEVVDFANRAIAELLEKLSPAEQLRVAGLGVAIPFNLWDWATILDVQAKEMASWRDHDIAAEIGANWQFPVYLQNDATSACGAELVFGSAERPSDFLHFFIGFFIGGGVVLNHNVYTGHSGNAGALGSSPILTESGETTQLIDIASLAALEKAVVAEGGNPRMIWESPSEWTVPEQVLESWINRAAGGIAQVIWSSCSVIDFSVVVIDGWLPDPVRRDLVARVRQILAGLPLAGINAPEVEEGTIGSDARSLGAASLPLSERFLLDSHSFMKS
ncbi:MAG: ROK family transcriptional regulator [Maritimibacter sp.]